MNFFPVIAEDEQGEMKELNAEDVLTIPRHIKSREVVRQKFMSNLLFKNIAGIFGASGELIDILNKIKPEEKKKNTKERRPVDLQHPRLNEHKEVYTPGEISINKKKEIFGDKIVRIDDLPVSGTVKDATDHVMESIQPKMATFKAHYALNQKQTDRVKKDIQQGVTDVINDEWEAYTVQSQNILEHYKEAGKDPHNEKTFDQLTQERQEKEQELLHTTQQNIGERSDEVLQQAVEKQENRVEQHKKNQTESDVRDHLRGFTRTIPAFLMAYGDNDTTLETFEEHIDPETFLEITSITIDEFKKLRDGFEYMDEDGEQQRFDGFFDEVVFNASIKEFFNKKDQLANYFDDSLTEDIFDYIPSQQTNQIYTPRGVVKLMVNKLEEENPDIFTNKDVKFIDLYTKSGLYLTELVKRLNTGLSDQILNQNERIHWILENQIYGVAPSDIIYNIAKNYVYGIHEDIDSSNLVQWDMAKSAQNGTMAKDLIEAYGGKQLKFDVVIGNPPYQEEITGTSARPIYPEFMDGAYEIADKVSLITPARFLFNAGKTANRWNQKMLHDPHIKVTYYNANSSKVFPNTDIKGGVAVTYRDIDKDFGAIDPFIPFEELKSILNKVNRKGYTSIKDTIYSPESYKLTDKLHRDHEEAESKLSNGHKYDVTTNIFEKLPELFVKDQTTDNGYVAVCGRLDNKRVQRWIKAEYIQGPDNFDKYKVFVPKSNGSGALGEVLSTPLLGTPLLGHTQTFISIGKFDTEEEALACMKYVKTKFMRVMLGILKITQHNPRDKWKYVPIQDFTTNSDIDWSKSIADIDQQLYKKYKLSESEIQFIEEKVQPME